MLFGHVGMPSEKFVINIICLPQAGRFIDIPIVKSRKEIS
jgi:hypothetical protein